MKVRTDAAKKADARRLLAKTKAMQMAVAATQAEAAAEALAQAAEKEHHIGEESPPPRVGLFAWLARWWTGT